MVVGPRAPQIHKIRLKNAFLQGNGGEGSQGCCGEVHRQQVFDQIAHARAQLQPVATALFNDLQGTVPLGVGGRQGDEGFFNASSVGVGQLGQFTDADGPTLEIKNRLEPGGQGWRRHHNPSRALKLPP